MFRLLADVFHFLLWWSFLYVGSFMLMVVTIVYLIKTNPSLPTPIIKQYHSTVQVVQPHKRVLVDREICNRISGCKVVSGTCPTCVIDKVWE